MISKTGFFFDFFDIFKSFGDGQTISFAFSTLASNSLESVMEGNEILTKEEMLPKLLKFLDGKGFDALKSLVIITQRVSF
jgi:hypothetical protein